MLRSKKAKSLTVSVFLPQKIFVALLIEVESPEILMWCLIYCESGVCLYISGADLTCLGGLFELQEETGGNTMNIINHLGVVVSVCPQ